MLLLICFILLVVLGVIMFFLISKNNQNNQEKHGFSFIEDHEVIFGSIAVIITTVGVMFAIILLTIKILVSITLSSEYAENKLQYEALLYKAETVAAHDEFRITNKDFIDDAIEWNKEFVKYKKLSENVWISFLFPEEAYEGMDVIDYDSMIMQE